MSAPGAVWSLPAERSSGKPRRGSSGFATSAPLVSVLCRSRFAAEGHPL
jgi:hypothetical protein